MGKSRNLSFNFQLFKLNFDMFKFTNFIWTVFHNWRVTAKKEDLLGRDYETPCTYIFINRCTLFTKEPPFSYIYQLPVSLGRVPHHLCQDNKFSLKILALPAKWQAFTKLLPGEKLTSILPCNFCFFGGGKFLKFEMKLLVCLFHCGNEGGIFDMDYVINNG